jgi:hypothetical protein
MFVNLVKGFLFSSNATSLPAIGSRDYSRFKATYLSDLSRNMMLSSKEVWHQINIRIVIDINL